MRFGVQPVVVDAYGLRSLPYLAEMNYFLNGSPDSCDDTFASCLAFLAAQTHYHLNFD